MIEKEAKPELTLVLLSTQSLVGKGMTFDT